MKLFAAEPEIVMPIGVAVDRNGRLLVIESRTHVSEGKYEGKETDRIRIMEDVDDDGKPDHVSTLLDGERGLMSIAIDPADGSILVAAVDHIFRLTKSHGGTQGYDKQNLLTLSGANTPHTGFSGLVFDPTGGFYFATGENIGTPYVIVGSDGAQCPGKDGGVFHCRPDGSGLTRVARGLWNAFSLCLDQTGRLMAVDNDPQNRPPCRMLHVVDGGDYGYRTYGGRNGEHPFSAWNGEIPGSLPMTGSVGEAPSGILPCEGSAFPADYHGDFLVTSWGDHRIERHHLETAGASFVSSGSPLVVGGEMFRPVSMAVAPDNSIYVTDWSDLSYNPHAFGRIWRLRLKRPDDSAATEVAASPVAATLEHQLAAPSLLVRAAALRRIPVERRDQIDEVLRQFEIGDPFLSQAARVAAARLLGENELLSLLDSPSSEIRLNALIIARTLGLSLSSEQMTNRVVDADERVRLFAVCWIGEEKLNGYSQLLEKMLAEDGASAVLFEATIAAIRAVRVGDAQTDAESDEVIESLHHENIIAQLLIDDNVSATVKARCLRSLRPDYYMLTVSFLQKLVESPDERIQLEAVRSLRENGDVQRLAVLEKIAGDATKSETIRGEAKLGVNAAPRVNRQIGDLSVDEWLLRLAGPADPVAGERLFFSPRGPGCYHCHAFNGRGARVGPDLTRAGRTLGQRKLVESILLPNKEMAPQYASWIVVLENGRVLTGMHAGVTVENFGLGPVTMHAYLRSDLVKELVPETEIEARHATKSSVMPAGLERTMTTQEFRDLIAALQRF